MGVKRYLIAGRSPVVVSKVLFLVFGTLPQVEEFFHSKNLKYDENPQRVEEKWS
jgi:hypothetical protein